MGCGGRCYERLKDKTWGSKILTHTRWIGGRGYRYQILWSWSTCSLRFELWVKCDGSGSGRNPPLHRNTRPEADVLKVHTPFTITITLCNPLPPLPIRFTGLLVVTLHVSFQTPWCVPRILSCRFRTRSSSWSFGEVISNKKRELPGKKNWRHFK